MRPIINSTEQRKLCTDQPKRKTLFSRSLREQTFSNANLRNENSARFRISSRRPFFFSAKTRGETPRTFSVKLRADTPRSLSESFKNVHSLNFCFVCFCGFMSQSTTLAMSRRSGNLNTLFLDRLPKRLTSTKCTSFRQ